MARTVTNAYRAHALYLTRLVKKLIKAIRRRLAFEETAYQAIRQRLGDKDASHWRDCLKQYQQRRPASNAQESKVILSLRRCCGTVLPETLPGDLHVALKQLQQNAEEKEDAVQMPIAAVFSWLTAYCEGTPFGTRRGVSWYTLDQEFAAVGAAPIVLTSPSPENHQPPPDVLVALSPEEKKELKGYFRWLNRKDSETARGQPEETTRKKKRKTTRPAPTFREALTLLLNLADESELPADEPAIFDLFQHRSSAAGGRARVPITAPFRPGTTPRAKEAGPAARILLALTERPGPLTTTDTLDHIVCVFCAAGGWTTGSKPEQAVALEQLLSLWESSLSVTRREGSARLRHVGELFVQLSFLEMVPPRMFPLPCVAQVERSRVLRMMLSTLCSVASQPQHSWLKLVVDNYVLLRSEQWTLRELSQALSCIRRQASASEATPESEQLPAENAAATEQQSWEVHLLPLRFNEDLTPSDSPEGIPQGLQLLYSNAIAAMLDNERVEMCAGFVNNTNLSSSRQRILDSFRLLLRSYFSAKFYPNFLPQNLRAQTTRLARTDTDVDAILQARNRLKVLAKWLTADNWMSIAFVLHKDTSQRKT